MKTFYKGAVVAHDHPQFGTSYYTVLKEKKTLVQVEDDDGKIITLQKSWLRPLARGEAAPTK